MLPKLTKAAIAGATVIASSQRLARALTEAHTSQQRRQGKSVWQSPTILPWDGLLNRLWREALTAGNGLFPILLNSTQELALWEEIVRTSPEGLDLLQVPQTSEKAMEAWKLIHAYRLPARAGPFAATEDCAAFFRWAQEFERRRDQYHWVEQARVPDLLVELLDEGRLDAPQPLYVAGFDEFTPQQQRLLEALGETREYPTPGFDPAPVCLSCRDSLDELWQAAAWARARLERNPEARVGIVVPNLARLRSKAERIFTSILQPGLDADRGPRAFHISIGTPLSDTPMIRAAFLILGLGRGEISLSRMGMLIRGPFLAGAEQERSQRALLDVRLRKRGLFRATIQDVQDSAGACPVLVSALSGIDKHLETARELQTPGEWGRTFSQVLKQAGWPGERSLSSHEYQTVQAWNDLLSRFETLDSVIDPVTLTGALDKLKQIAGTTLFQPEDEGAPVQVMGLFESSGLLFDHLWVSGLHDEALPAPARPNPFLPIELQRARDLPRSSSARELEVAKGLMQRFLESAPELVFSHPMQEGDQRLGPSPLLGLASPAPGPAIQDALTWLDAMKSTASLEAVVDAAAPAAAADAVQHGGTSLLRDMAACHFRAWAQNRAGARPLEEPEAGISSRDSGTAVHKAMDLIWRELQTHGALCALTAQQSAELISRSIRSALSKMTGLGRAIEQQRLEKLIGTWLEIEKQRLPFTVIATERKEIVSIGDLRLETRVDRLDELENGRHLILDYKTGEVKAGCWSGDRPDEPQLLVYAAYDSGPIGGAAFAQIRAGKIGFHGITADADCLPGMRSFAAKGIGFDLQIAEWRRIIDALATAFGSGNAEVNPKQNACEYCGFTALCRVRDDHGE